MLLRLCGSDIYQAGSRSSRYGQEHLTTPTHCFCTKERKMTSYPRSLLSFKGNNATSAGSEIARWLMRGGHTTQVVQCFIFSPPAPHHLSAEEFMSLALQTAQGYTCFAGL